ncbi:fungal-specific transcription factor domain-containing protein [Xylariaceae sp. FL0016]|nr:fungal-specific transcription factor domain-containing protein [Xylariaceae sp. FL0016]
MAGASKGTRSRTFTGCKTCRARHAKCDETRPKCKACQRLGLPCEGYGPQLCWIMDDSVPGTAALTAELRQNHRGSGYRYPLFTEGYRRHMSDQLMSSIGKRSATDILLQLEVSSESQEEEGARRVEDLMLGPFGVFNTKSLLPVLNQDSSPHKDPESTESLALQPTLANDEIPPGNPAVNEDWTDCLGELDIDMLLDDLGPSLETPGQNQSRMPCVSSFMPPATALFPAFDSDDSLDMGTSIFAELDSSKMLPISAFDTGHEYQDENDEEALTLAPNIGAQAMGEHGSPVIPEQAEHLLRFFRQRIMRPSSRIQANRKSPWQILFLPCALETFAEITIFSQASHTRSAVLYAILSNSAFQLYAVNHHDTTSSRWLEVGKRHRNAAKQHLRKALQVDMVGPNQADYKDLLMAMLACAMTSLYDSANTFKLYLLDAERLIRLRGLSAKRSFKIRLLHHLYTHLRVLSESTAVGSESKEHGEGQLGLTCQSAVTLRRFRVAEDNLTQGLDPSHIKDDDMGYNDIHLEVQGTWKETLFPMIYGIPESLITLLSQVISLANDKARLESIARKSSKISTALTSHIKTLENSVWSWKLPDGPLPPQYQTSAHCESQSLLEQPDIRSMVLAMHQAIIIYFYRRIYNMSAMMLQGNVKKTLEYLQPCIDEGVEDQDFAATIAWPIFIAGCEAASTELQEHAMRNIAIVENRASVFSPEPASHVFKRVWEQRAKTQDWTLSWPNMMPQVTI